MLRKCYVELKLRQEIPKVQGVNGDNLVKNQEEKKKTTKKTQGKRAGEAGKNQVLWV